MNLVLPPDSPPFVTKTRRRPKRNTLSNGVVASTSKVVVTKKVSVCIYCLCILGKDGMGVAHVRLSDHIYRSNIMVSLVDFVPNQECANCVGL